ncbi:flavin-containing monooxygenase [Colletotrichum scovillei]|nr:flavin-containing monooxygenase [Colletotrichum scovillei]KAH8422116.1 flavin-containing monooxygenase [Colletotrichum scovillei]
MIKLHGMAQENSARFDALERAGFKTERFGDIISVLYDKLGGHYIDVGTSAKISQGQIKVKADSTPLRYTSRGLSFSDGTEVTADVIVFATGFVSNLKDVITQYVGQPVADQIQDFWGVDNEGEINGAFKYPGHPGMWFTGGTIGHARFFGRFIALQIKADIIGYPFRRFEDS